MMMIKRYNDNDDDNEIGRMIMIILVVRLIDQKRKDEPGLPMIMHSVVGRGLTISMMMMITMMMVK